MRSDIAMDLGRSSHLDLINVLEFCSYAQKHTHRHTRAHKHKYPQELPATFLVLSIPLSRPFEIFLTSCRDEEDKGVGSTVLVCSLRRNKRDLQTLVNRAPFSPFELISSPSLSPSFLLLLGGF